jgi:tetratricopeptide (TPR) repeat protein
MQFKAILPVIIAMLMSVQLRAQGTKNTQSSKQEQARIDSLYKRAFRCDLFSNVRQKFLDTIISIRHNEAYAWQQKSMPLFKCHKYEVGIKYLDSAVKYDNGYHWLEYRGFMKCIFQKNYASAIADLKQAERMNPKGVVMDHTYDFYQGLSFLQLNEYDSSEHYISRSLEAGIKRIGEGHFLEHFYLGIVMMEKDRLPEAIKQFDKAITGYRNFSDAKFYKGKCLKLLGDSAQAATWFKDASADLKKGYTISEDNVIYEEYPYQLRKDWLQKVD